MQFDVAHTFYCQFPGGADAIIIAVEVELQKVLWLIGRSAGEAVLTLLKPMFSRGSTSTKASITRTGLSEAIRSSRVEVRVQGIYGKLPVLVL